MNKPIGFLEIYLSSNHIIGIFQYSLAYACLKLVNYSFFFWLPFYLHAHYGWKESVADELSTWYDIGGIVAAVVAGIASVSYRIVISIIKRYVLNYFKNNNP